MCLESVSSFFRIFKQFNVNIDFETLWFISAELSQLSGVAAILRFPIADLSEAEEDSSSDED